MDRSQLQMRVLDELKDVLGMDERPSMSDFLFGRGEGKLDMEGADLLDLQYRFRKMKVEISLNEVLALDIFSSLEYYDPEEALLTEEGFRHLRTRMPWACFAVLEDRARRAPMVSENVYDLGLKVADVVELFCSRTPVTN